MSTNRTTQPTEKQRAKLAALKQNFGLSDSDIDRCLFFSQDQDVPYIPPEILIAIARSTKAFQSIIPEYSTYVEALKQIIYKATVVDPDGREITRIGVATIGEKPGGYEIDPHKLAEGRAIGNALSDSGFNPFKSHFLSGLAVGIIELSRAGESNPFGFSTRDVEADLRGRDLRRIHALAEEKGLIIRLPSGGNISTPYRDWLSTNFQTRTVAAMDAASRAQVINALSNYEPDDFMNGVPAELREDALIA